MIRHAVFVVVLLVFIAAALVWLRVQTAPLDAIVRGGDAPPTVVLLHGYGSRAEDWLQFEGTIKVPNNGRLIFPRAPLRGLSGRHGWWWLNLDGQIPQGGRWPDLSASSPGGIKVASRLVRDYLGGIDGPIVLGGFSQGAMLSAEIAFQTDQDLAGLILLSGTTVNEEAWAEHFAGRRHLPIFIAHGRNDGVLPFAVMERFQARLQAFGLNVTWLPFDGGHEIPDDVVRAINAFVGRIVEPDRRF